MASHQIKRFPRRSLILPAEGSRALLRKGIYVPMFGDGAEAAKEIGVRTVERMIEQSPLAAVVTDPRQPDNPIVAVNAAFTALTGYAAGDCVGRNCRFLTGSGTEDVARSELRAAIAVGRSALVELTNYRKDGTSFLNAVMIAPIKDAEGKVAYFLSSQMEVTDESGSSFRLRQSRAADLVAALTPRQAQVLEHMVRGYRNKQIAAIIGISEKTVKMHRAGLLAKLGADTSAEAIRIGAEAGLGS